MASPSPAKIIEINRSVKRHIIGLKALPSVEGRAGEEGTAALVNIPC
jgi:hypothetical protein